MAGSWQPTDGRMELTQYDISVENAGTLGMTFDLGGYTPDFVKSIQDLKKDGGSTGRLRQFGTGPGYPRPHAAAHLQRATIRWDDDSLTKKVLDFVATSQGQKPEDIANQAKAIVPFLMAQLNNPELSRRRPTR